MISRELTPQQLSNYAELNNWVIDTFGKQRDLASFLDAFNNHLIGFQKDSQKKLLLDSIKEGYVSCSAAALVTALWWRLINPRITPFFLITQESKEATSPAWLHVTVAFPMINFLVDNLGIELELYQQEKPNDLTIVDYRFFQDAKRGYIRSTPPEGLTTNYRLVRGILDFYIDRCEIFNFLQESDPSPPAGPSSSPSTHLAPTFQQPK